MIEVKTHCSRRESEHVPFPLPFNLTSASDDKSQAEFSPETIYQSPQERKFLILIEWSRIFLLVER